MSDDLLAGIDALIRELWGNTPVQPAVIYMPAWWFNEMHRQAPVRKLRGVRGRKYALSWRRRV